MGLTPTGKRGKSGEKRRKSENKRTSRSFIAILSQYHGEKAMADMGKHGLDSKQWTINPTMRHARILDECQPRPARIHSERTAKRDADETQTRQPQTQRTCGQPRNRNRRTAEGGYI
jgi:hypothetical protein